MSLRPKEYPRKGYMNDHFHGRYICKRCSGEVHDWGKHDAWHEDQAAELDELRAMIRAFITGGPGEPGEPPSRWTAEQVPDDDPMVELRDRANAEGNAVTEASFLRGGLRQVRDVLRIRPPARMGLAAAVLAVLLSGCQVHGWAHRDCSAHEGHTLSKVGRCVYCSCGYRYQGSLPTADERHEAAASVQDTA